MRIVPCTHAEHADAILALLNDAILHSTALYEYAPRPRASMRAWFEAKQAGGFPVLGAVDDDDRLLGFATFGPFRPHAAYKYSVEHSVYVREDQRRRGVGRALLTQLIAAARDQQRHQLIGGIDVENRASIALHESLGFVHAGTVRQAGFKFGRWLDLAFYQLLLDTPERPVDG